MAHCSQCGKVWILEIERGLCPWCNKPGSCQSTRTKPRPLKSSRRRKQRQAPNDNGYDELDGQWAVYYKVASRFARKALLQDREDLLHDIILTLAAAQRNNGHKPFTEVALYRIASRAVADYWRSHYEHTNGLDCRHCSKAQRQKCKEDWLYPDCPKAVKLEYLSKPMLDDEGNLTELGELIADDKAVELDAWVSDTTWEIGYPQRLVAIAYKLKAGEALINRDRQYLWYWRKQEQKKLGLS